MFAFFIRTILEYNISFILLTAILYFSLIRLHDTFIDIMHFIIVLKSLKRRKRFEHYEKNLTLASIFS